MYPTRRVACCRGLKILRGLVSWEWALPFDPLICGGTHKLNWNHKAVVNSLNEVFTKPCGLAHWIALFANRKWP